MPASGLNPIEDEGGPRYEERRRFLKLQHDMESRVSWLIHLLAETPQTEVISSYVERTYGTEPAIIGHIFYKETEPNCVNQCHIVIHNAHVPTFQPSATKPEFTNGLDNAFDAGITETHPADAGHRTTD